MTESAHQIRDVIIIGSGPAGYTAAVYAARAQLSPLVFEGSEYGGALMTTTAVENFPGFVDGIMGPELMDQMRAQSQRFGAELVSHDVEEVDLRSDIKSVTVRGTTYRSRSVILAMGASPRYLGVPGEERLLGRGVSSCATCDGFFFKDLDVAVVGGGDSAMEEAQFLTRFCRTVTVVHRSHDLRASRIMLERSQANPGIRWQLGKSVVEARGEESLSSVLLRDVQEGTETELAVSGMFVAIGHEPRSKLVAGQVATDADGYVVTASAGTATDVAGVFACGDLVDRTYRQAITAAGSGCSAAIDAERWLSEHGVPSQSEIQHESFRSPALNFNDEVAVNVS